MKKYRKYIIGIGVFIILIGGYVIIDNLLFTGLKPIAINENGFQANYFVEKTSENNAAGILIGGGQWGDYWGIQLAKKGFVGLSLPYIGKEGLPSRCMLIYINIRQIRFFTSPDIKCSLITNLN